MGRRRIPGDARGAHPSGRPCRSGRGLWVRLLACAGLCLLLPGAAAGYVDDTRQQLTFLAAKQFNQCLVGTPLPRLSALQVRNLVRGNLSESDGLVRQATQWRFYDRSNQSTPRMLWSVDTRMHARFDGVAAETLSAAEPRELNRYENLGAVIHYLQGVTVPANVVPIFHPRPWRWPAVDQFTRYPLDRDRLTAELGSVCVELLSTPKTETLETLLDRTAAVTIANIRAPIADMAASWQVFWKEEDAGEFGSYGPAGNRFGRHAEFPCRSERCELLENDPIYADFALAQHRLAVVSTMRAMLILQRYRAERDASLENRLY